MERDAADVAAYKRSGDWGETTVGDAVAGWARTRPDADAFVTVGPDGSVTRTSWAQYDERATRLARVLAGGRLARGDRIAVVLPDGAAVHVAFVAAERAGLTVVGIGHQAGDAELRHLLGLTEARALLTVAEHRGRPATELFGELQAEGRPLVHHIVIDAEAADDSIVDGAVTSPRDV